MGLISPNENRPNERFPNENRPNERFPNERYKRNILENF
jgi:hypothetical protein